MPDPDIRSLSSLGALGFGPILGPSAARQPISGEDEQCSGALLRTDPAVHNDKCNLDTHGGGGVMDKLESQGPDSYNRVQSGTDDLIVAPSERMTPDFQTDVPDGVAKTGNVLHDSLEQRVSRRPKVSVMVITYNHEKYIAQALESVLMQETDFDFEINVIEDCSTDRTQEVVMRYVRKYPHIVKPYFNKKNIGFKVTQKNFYRGFRTLTGDYLAILEGDDYWTSPHKLQKQVDFLEANRDFAICAHNTLKVYEDGASDSHRFLYWGRRGDATVQDVICLQSFFHTTGILYRNVFKGIPPRHYRSKWSCDIFVMISHAAFGKVHHIDEDWAVYRAHAGGRFSGMSPVDGWFFNIDSLRRYNAWLGYRYMRTFSVSISRYCEHVLKSHGKEGAATLKSYQLMKILTLWACYRSIFHVLNLPKYMFNLSTYVLKRLMYVLIQSLPPAHVLIRSKALAARMALRRTRLSELPQLPGSAHWDLVWGLNVKTIEGQRIVADHPILQLTAVHTGDKAAQRRHALSACIGGLTPGGTYRVLLWVKPIDGTNVQLSLRDSTRGETGIPANEGEARYNISLPSVMMDNGLLSPRVQPDRDGWQKVWADITTEDGKIFAYLGLLNVDNSHVFKGHGERLLFGGVEISHRPSTTRLSELPPLQGSAHWDLVWGLNVKTIEEQRIVADYPILRLTAVHTNDKAAYHRHALSACINGLAPGGNYRVLLWVKPVAGLNVQVDLRDSTRGETGIPANEGEARYDLSSRSVMMVNGLPSSGVEPNLDGWQKVWGDLTTEDGKIFAYLGLLNVDNCHVFHGHGEQLLFGGIEITPQPVVDRRPSGL